MQLRNLCKRSEMINIYTDPITRRKLIQPFWCGNVENMDRFTTDVNYWSNIPVYHWNQSPGHAPFRVYLQTYTTARMQPRCANYRSQKVQSVDSKAFRPTTTNEKTMCETYRQFHGSLSYYYLVYIIVNRGSSIYTISKHNRNKKLFLFI